MSTLSKEYLLLFNTVTDTLQTLQQLCAELIAAQQRAEELYLASGDPDRTGA